MSCGDTMAADMMAKSAITSCTTNASTGLMATPTGQHVSNPQMDMNMYATRKTIAQGIMDLGLMCANASQLKYVLLNSNQHKYFDVTIALITLSIILQIVVGIVFILLGRLNINFFIDRKKADLLNNVSVILIFLITVVNVLITAFGPTDTASGHIQQPSAWTNFYPGKIQDPQSAIDDKELLAIPPNDRTFLLLFLGLTYSPMSTPLL
ncbi:ninjurin-A-like [Oppia nitens]|uniref:ninjurin-A-like n=1 Tax=Oppia nitens TaxID=1686743 RepID=UPI0023DAEABD|nr:ninjurin-A-like [Oppia nitens]